MLNLKVRFKNPIFWTQIAAAVAMPMLAYANLTPQDLTTWGSVIEVIKQAILNPYIVGMVAVSVWNALNDPTTRGLSDSAKAMAYKRPSS